MTSTFHLTFMEDSETYSEGTYQSSIVPTKTIKKIHRKNQELTTYVKLLFND